MSQEKLGALAGLPRTTINKIESGASSMAMARTRDALAGALGLTRDEFEAALRDVNAMCGHLVFQRTMMEDAGRVVFGKAATLPVF